jgi:hypothetical protein
MNQFISFYTEKSLSFSGPNVSSSFPTNITAPYDKWSRKRLQREALLSTLSSAQWTGQTLTLLNILRPTGNVDFHVSPRKMILIVSDLSAVWAANRRRNFVVRKEPLLENSESQLKNERSSPYLGSFMYKNYTLCTCVYICIVHVSVRYIKQYRRQEPCFVV